MFFYLRLAFYAILLYINGTANTRGERTKMVVNKEMATIYDIIIEGSDIITKNLIAKGITVHRIGILVNTGKIEPTEPGHYKLTNENLEECETYKQALAQDERVIVISNLERKVFDIYLKRGVLTRTLLKNAKLTDGQIDMLLSEKYIKETSPNNYVPCHTTLLNKYKRELAEHPEIMSWDESKQEDENIKRLVIILLEEGKLTKKVLKKHKFTEKEIDDLVRTEILVTLPNDNYAPKEMDTFLFYFDGTKEISAEKRDSYHNICYMNDYMRSSFGPVLNDFILTNYETAFSDLQNYKEFKSPHIQDYNFYLFILSFLIKLPIEIVKKVKAFTFEDVQIPSYSSDAFVINRIRELIIDLNFKTALTFLKSLETNFQNSKEIFFLKSILSMIIEEQQLFKDNFRAAIREENIRLAFHLLHQELGEHKMERKMNYYYRILADIIEMRNTKMSLEASESKNNSLAQLIASRNYRSAKQKSEQIALKKKMSPKDNDLCTLLFVAQRTQATLSTSPFHIIELFKEKMQEAKKDEAIFYLKCFLKNNSRTEYLYVVDAFIELSSPDVEFDYEKFKHLLSSIVEGSFYFDYDECISLYLDFLENRQMARANYCIAILRKAMEAHHVDMDKDRLLVELQAMREMFTKEKNGNSIPFKKNEKTNGEN